MNSTKTTIDCKACRESMADLLLDEDFAATQPVLLAHMADCNDCATELKDLRATMEMMDEWTAPEPSPYFDSKMHVLLREEMNRQPEGLWERTKSFLLFSTGRHLRPALSGALACAMLIGGGTFGLYVHQATQSASSATVNDLKILDNNAQALQQMDQLLDDSDDDGPPPVS